MVQTLHTAWSTWLLPWAFTLCLNELAGKSRWSSKPNAEASFPSPVSYFNGLVIPLVELFRGSKFADSISFSWGKFVRCRKMVHDDSWFALWQLVTKTNFKDWKKKVNFVQNIHLTRGQYAATNLDQCKQGRFPEQATSSNRHQRFIIW